MGYKTANFISLVYLLTRLPFSEPSPQCATLGKVYTLSLGYKPENTDDIIWKDQSQRLVRRKNMKVSDLREYVNIDQNASLLLNFLKKTDEKIYTAEVFNEAGKRVHKINIPLKVVESVSKPYLTIDCSTKTISCGARSIDEGTLELELNGKSLNISSGNVTYNVKEQYAHSPKITCIAKNCASVEKNETEMKCVGSDNKEDKILGLDFWTFIAVIAGIGALILVVISVLLVCHCKKRRNQQHSQVNEVPPSNMPPSHQRQAKLQPPPRTRSKAQPQSRGQTPALPKPRAQARPKPQHNIDPLLVEEQPPPRPKPRSKSANPNKC
ncbi:T-cell surface antigen CD2 isoform X1 [Amia ocellicauda]|uniref:T-cell surface antigen CD2 isoform X1 n=1 Tax=Amia ocellicauda TaxID=2972642 RepID=UPI003464B7CC